MKVHAFACMYVYIHICMLLSYSFAVTILCMYVYSNNQTYLVCSLHILNTEELSCLLQCRLALYLRICNQTKTTLNLSNSLYYTYSRVDTISSLQFFALLALVLFVCVSVCLCIRNYNFEFIFISLMDLKLLKHEFENPKQNRWPIFLIDQFILHIFFYNHVNFPCLDYFIFMIIFIFIFICCKPKLETTICFATCSTLWVIRVPKF